MEFKKPKMAFNFYEMDLENRTFEPSGMEMVDNSKNGHFSPVLEW